MIRSKPNLKLMNSVHTEARIKKNSQILSILHDVDDLGFFYGRMIETIRMAKHDPTNADAHLCLLSQLATITRTKIREDKGVDDLVRGLGSNKVIVDDKRRNASGIDDIRCSAVVRGIRCTFIEGHSGDHLGTDDTTWRSDVFDYGNNFCQSECLPGQKCTLKNGHTGDHRGDDKSVWSDPPRHAN